MFRNKCRYCFAIDEYLRIVSVIQCIPSIATDVLLPISNARILNKRLHRPQSTGSCDLPLERVITRSKCSQNTFALGIILNVKMYVKCPKTAIQPFVWYFNPHKRASSKKTAAAWRSEGQTNVFETAFLHFVLRARRSRHSCESCVSCSAVLLATTRAWNVVPVYTSYGAVEIIERGLRFGYGTHSVTVITVIAFGSAPTASRDKHPTRHLRQDDRP